MSDYISEIVESAPKTKVCSKCNVALSFTKFGVNNSTIDGFQPFCRDCGNKAQNKYRLNNKEKVRERNRVRAVERRKDFTYRLQMLLNASKQRAKIKGREHTLTLDDIVELYPKDNKCPVFGFTLEFNSAGFRETSPSIDRIDSSKGYTKENIQIISWKANRLKAYATLEDLEMLVAFMKQGD